MYPPRWTTEETTLLQQRFLEGDLSTIARQIGRTITAVQCKAYRMGLFNHALVARYRNDWSIEDQFLLRRGWQAGRSIAELAQELQRTPMGVRSQASRLRLNRPTWWKFSRFRQPVLNALRKGWRTRAQILNEVPIKRGNLKSLMSILVEEGAILRIGPIHGGRVLWTVAP